MNQLICNTNRRFLCQLQGYFLTNALCTLYINDTKLSFSEYWIKASCAINQTLTLTTYLSPLAQQTEMNLKSYVFLCRVRDLYKSVSSYS